MMENRYLNTTGLVVSPDSLEVTRCREVALAMGKLAFVRLVECRRRIVADGTIRETIIFDVEVERPQRCIHDIRRVERIAAEFEITDSWYPEVTSLRADFPNVPHLNLRDNEYPRSLCLYDQPWAEIALRWTASGFIERVRTWLAETAKGILHKEDQPLEPALAGTGLSIILPHQLFSSWEDLEAKQLQVGFATPEKDCRVLLTHPDARTDGLSVVAICLKAKPRKQTAISRRPKTLAELHDLLSIDGCDLRERLRVQLEAVDKKHRGDRRLLIVIGFPLSRKSDQEIEITDVWAFLTLQHIVDVGIAIGLWMKVPGDQQLGKVMGAMPNALGNDIAIEVIAPQYALSRETAAAASNTLPDKRKTIAVGAGALGSQVTRLLAQAGFGSWTVVDDDVLAPHNTARHALSTTWTGWSKARALAHELSGMYPPEIPPLPIVGDFIRLSREDEKLKQAIKSSELILDMSASIPVARHISHDIDCDARRVSLFLNPSGSDLVMLMEDRDRSISLACLEMQYYREIAFNEHLLKHLAPPPGRIRYARSCRDVSSVIPASMVALHSAIAAEEIRNSSLNSDSRALIWQTTAAPIEVRKTELPIHYVDRATFGDWTLVVSRLVGRRLAELREAKLPNETGGVLIGGYDLSRKVIYIVDTIPSPADSKEWPTLYIRGSSGLAREVQRINDVTDGQLEYVGEWHSHPDGCSCQPSNDDIEVFTWLTENMNDAGLPPLMGIAGHGRVAWYLGEAQGNVGWEVPND